MQEFRHKDTTPQRVLVVMAHPDDIEFGAAGSAAHWIAGGAEVTYCVVTDGSAGSNTPGEDLEQLVLTRQDEQRRAASIIGVKSVIFLGYKDGVLQPTLELRRDITRVIRQVRPDRVVAQDPSTIYWRDGYINHPDHRAAGEATLYAVFPSAETRPIFPELLDEGLEPHKVKTLYLTLASEPTVAVDISTTIDHKIEALMCHQSQVSEEAGRWVTERSKEYGEKAGMAYAEIFRMLKFVPDEDEASQD